jgi:broad specificity phosphatase PhoE
MTARIYIVRHGNTFEKGDVVTRVGGRTDLPLSPSGRTQAEALGAHFKDIDFVSARSGPLKRTRETAVAILKGRETPELMTELFLREIDYGRSMSLPGSGRKLWRRGRRMAFRRRAGVSIRRRWSGTGRSCSASWARSQARIWW